MPTPHAVYCGECADALVITRWNMNSDGDVTVYVLPCETCLKEARKAAKEDSDYLLPRPAQPGARQTR